jgi:peptide/nickel transport system substrate-binding protein
VVNENYWGAKPNVTEVNVRFVSEESSRVVALRSGEVDVIDSITPDSVAQLKSVDGIKIESVTGTRYNQLFYNFRKRAGSPMSDPKVREALSYGFDSKSVVDGILGGTVTSGIAGGGTFEAGPPGGYSHGEPRPWRVVQPFSGGSSSMTAAIKSRRRRSLAAGET